MTPRQKQLIRESFREVRDVAGPLSQLFYGRLFERNPSVRRMFHGDIQRQGIKLMEMLSAVVDNLDRLESLRPTLHAMGQRHVAYGVEPAHYDAVSDALLWALRQELAGALDTETQSAWRTVIAQVSEIMKEGAAMLHETRTDFS